MPIYAVSFRIANKIVNGKTYDDRYKATEAALRKTRKFWNNTTSFHFVNTTEAPVQFLARLVKESKLEQTDDHLVMVQVDLSTTGKIGTIGKETEADIRHALGLP